MLLFSSCSKSSDSKNNERLVKDYKNMVLGWGMGRANRPAYVSLKSGVPQTFVAVDPSDRATQELIDVVFPGDFGNPGGGLFISSPSSTGAGGAAFEYCKDWLRKRGTRFAELNGFDLARFEKVTTVDQLLALEKENAPYYYDFIGLPSEGTSFIVRTEDGDIAIAYIHTINGTYGSDNANVTISWKTIPQ